eukprot:SAG31_NODE_31031_length_373_cov_0.759124_1_plen_28_part_01
MGGLTAATEACRSCAFGLEGAKLEFDAA